MSFDARPQVLTAMESGPEVICLNGAGGIWADWLALGGELSGFGTVATLQRSSPDQDLMVITDRIVAELDELGFGRVIVVAHSMGAFEAEALARLRPERVLGLVLADPSVAHPHHTLESVAERVVDVGIGVFGGALDRLHLRDRIGPRIRRRVEPASARGAYPRRDIVDHIASTAEHWRLVAEDFAVYEPWNDQLLELRERRPLTAQLPIVVVSAVSPVGLRWARQQDSLVERLRADGAAVRHVVQHGAPHQIHLSNPELIAAEVRSLLADQDN